MSIERFSNPSYCHISIGLFLYKLNESVEFEGEALFLCPIVFFIQFISFQII